jgi:hypothetical protein
MQFLEEDVSCAVFAFIRVEWGGRAELGRAGVWLVLKPGLDLPLIHVLLLHIFASDSDGLGLGSRQVIDSMGKKYFAIVSLPMSDPAGRTEAGMKKSASRGN